MDLLKVCVTGVRTRCCRKALKGRVVCQERTMEISGSSVSRRGTSLRTFPYAVADEAHKTCGLKDTSVDEGPRGAWQESSSRRLRSVMVPCILSTVDIVTTPPLLQNKGPLVSKPASSISVEDTYGGNLQDTLARLVVTETCTPPAACRPSRPDCASFTKKLVGLLGIDTIYMACLSCILTIT